MDFFLSLPVSLSSTVILNLFLTFALVFVSICIFIFQNMNSLPADSVRVMLT